MHIRAALGRGYLETGRSRPARDRLTREKKGVGPGSMSDVTRPGPGFNQIVEDDGREVRFGRKRGTF